MSVAGKDRGSKIDFHCLALAEYILAVKGGVTAKRAGSSTGVARHTYMEQNQSGGSVQRHNLRGLTVAHKY